MNDPQSNDIDRLLIISASYGDITCAECGHKLYAERKDGHNPIPFGEFKTKCPNCSSEITFWGLIHYTNNL